MLNSFNKKSIRFEMEEVDNYVGSLERRKCLGY